MKIILASASPRRKEILEQHSIFPIVKPSNVEEIVPEEIEALGVEEIVKYLAHIKGLSIYHEESKKIKKYKASEKRIVILGADTIVYKNRIIGKPKNEEEAFSILNSLKNTSHHVYTGVSLIDLYSGKEIKFYDDTKVYFKDYSDEEIRRFISEEPPYDKSGSYAIQSSWSKNVDRIEGDINNVIGLPWEKLKTFLWNIDEH